MNEEDKDKEIKISSKRYAALFADPKMQAGATYTMLKDNDEHFDLDDIVSALIKQNDILKKGNTQRLEEMLLSQAHTLDLLFNKQLRQARMQGSLEHFKEHLNIGLKAQRQCRATIETLLTAKTPKSLIQNNIAEYQQVNNGKTEKKQKTENELLEKDNETQWLDTGTAKETGRDDKNVEALETQHRA